MPANSTPRSPRPAACEYIENPVPPEYLNTIIAKSSEAMAELPDHSVHLMVTSPPYNVGKDYDEDLTLEEYLGFLAPGLAGGPPGPGAGWPGLRQHRQPGAQTLYSAPFLYRAGYGRDRLSHARRNHLEQGRQRLAVHGLGQLALAGQPDAWDVHEYILIFSKAGFSRPNPAKRRATISRDEFLELTKSVWTFPAVSARSVGHPAPFPVELPHRLIQLYTFEGDIVLDPFMGSGQTAIAAVQGQRRYVGYEIEADYLRLAQRRVNTVHPGSYVAQPPGPRR